MTESNDIIDRVEAALKSAKKTIKHPPRWLSSRLWITVGSAAALLWLMQGQVGSVLTHITVLTVTFLVCRTATDITTLIINKPKDGPDA